MGQYHALVDLLYKIGILLLWIPQQFEEWSLAYSELLTTSVIIA